MFSYIDHFFDDDSYRKLALNFEIEDITFAEASVDRRMAGEMERGREAVESGDAGRVVDANQGGPYGSAVLAGVQAASRENVAAHFGRRGRRRRRVVVQGRVPHHAARRRALDARRRRGRGDGLRVHAAAAARRPRGGSLRNLAVTGNSRAASPDLSVLSFDADTTP